MELPIFFILLAFGLSVAFSLPKNSGHLEKDHYRRQILQPIPGYIPVYIKTEEVPLLRKEKVSQNKQAHIEKQTELELSSQPRNKDKETLSQTEDKNDKIKKEGALKKDKTAIHNIENPIKVDLKKIKTL